MYSFDIDIENLPRGFNLSNSRYEFYQTYHNDVFKRSHYTEIVITGTTSRKFISLDPLFSSWLKEQDIDGFFNYLAYHRHEYDSSIIGFTVSRNPELVKLSWF